MEERGVSAQAAATITTFSTPGDNQNPDTEFISWNPSLGERVGGSLEKQQMSLKMGGGLPESPPGSPFTGFTVKYS